MLILIWMFAAIINTTMVGAVVNRNNILYYPWILCAAYALWQMGRRLRTALAAMVVMIAIGFAGACGVYFTDADYQTETANNFYYGLQDALREAWDWDCDRYYLTTMSRNDGEKTMTTQVMFAHRIDYAMRSGGRRSFAVGTESRTDGILRSDMSSRISRISRPTRRNVRSISSDRTRRRCLTRQII